MNKGAAGDWVFEIEVTPNRPDWLSIMGIAREAAAITGKKVKLDSRCSMFDARKSKHRTANPKDLRLKINIESKRDCPLYTARIIKGVKVKPSPRWLKERLESVGLRSVNNIVDITNYLLLETGQPLHAFDLDRLTAPWKIVIRRARNKEEITTIDGIKRILNEDMLIIASGTNGRTSKQASRQADKPIAIAGIMGGCDSEVSQDTKDILLEAAVFDPIITRRASRKLGLLSESSYRFERGLDWQNVDFASWRAVDFILELAGGEFVLNKATALPKTQKKTVILQPGEVNRALGRNYNPKEIKKILSCLSFSISKQQGNSLKIEAPSFRTDVNQPVDLIEEIARLSGYENIPTSLPRVIPQIDASLVRNRRKIIKDTPISQGINEVITYSLISKNLANQFAYLDSQIIPIANPLTSQQEVLRPGLIPGLVSCIGYNLNQKQTDIRIFEIGNVFQMKPGFSYSSSGLLSRRCKAQQEQVFLGLAYSGKDINLLYIKGILELLLERLGIGDFEFLKNDSEHPFFQRGTVLSLMLNPVRNTTLPKGRTKISNGVNKKICATLGMVKPDILEELDIKDLIFAAELELDLLFVKMQKIQKRYIPMPLYPEVTRDISVVLEQGILIGDIMKKIKLNNIPYLVEVNLKDYYVGEQIPPGYKGLTLSCIYRASDHTLITQEVESVHQEVLNILKTEFFAQQR